MIVTRQHQHAAMRGGARRIGVLEHVTRAVDARSLAVPHAEHTVVFPGWPQIGLLCPPHRGCRKFLVDARLEYDVALCQMRFCLPQCLVQRAERGSAIAGDVSRGVQSLQPVALSLQHRQPNQCLRAADVDAAFFERVFVVERDGGQCRLLRRGKWRVHSSLSPLF